MERTALVRLLAAALIVCSTGTALAGGVDQDADVRQVSYEGNGAIDGLGDDLHVWRQATHRFSVTVRSDSGLANGTLCLFADPDGGGSVELGCRGLAVSANETVTRTLDVGQWPTNATGSGVVRVTVDAPNRTAPLAFRRAPITVLRRGGDVDDDGLTNEREIALGTDLESNDTDGDGLADGPEVRTYGTSPTNADTDDDGLDDGAEIETHQTDPTKPDTDDDGLTDPQELERGTDPNKADTDGDGVSDGLEVNTYETDPTDPDSDGDGLDDGAEINEYETNPLDEDTDDDGLDDNLEVNTYETDPNKIDTDGDGIQDGVEVDRYQTDPTKADTDGDGLSDGAEINTYDTNPKNADSDGDGLTDGQEVRRYETDPNDADTDGDGRSDAVEVDAGRLDGDRRLIVGAAGLVVLVAVGGFAYWSGRNPLAWSRRAFARRLGALRAAFGGRAAGRSETRGRVAGRSGGRGGDDGRETDPGGSDSRKTDAGRSGSRGTGAGRSDAPGTDGTRPDEAATVPGDESNGSSGDEPVATNGAPEAAGPDPDSDSGPTGPDVPPEFLSNEDRVLAIVDEHDGRIRQTDLVGETDWSKSKVSRVLSGMEANDAIVKVDVGRGNVVMRPEDVPPGAESALDE